MKHTIFLSIFCMFLLLPLTQALGDGASVNNQATETICKLACKSFEMGAKLRCKGVSKDEAITIIKTVVKESARDIPVFKQDRELYKAAEAISLTGVRAAYAVEKLDCDEIPLQSLMFKAVCVTEIGKRLKGMSK